MSESDEKPYKLPNSKYWRDWCQSCGEPQRVAFRNIGKVTGCDQCGQDTKFITPRKRIAHVTCKRERLCKEIKPQSSRGIEFNTKN